MYCHIHLYLSYLFLCIPKHDDTYKIMYQSYPIDIIFRNVLCGIAFFNSFPECHVHGDTNNVIGV